MQLATYRLYRSSALWFARQKDGHSITVRDGQTFNFAKGESKRWANYWLGRARESWDKLLVALGVPDLCSGMSAEGVLFVHAADSQHDTESDCICPECTARMIDERTIE
jgi:hypothetical protein